MSGAYFYSCSCRVKLCLRDGAVHLCIENRIVNGESDMVAATCDMPETESSWLSDIALSHFVIQSSKLTLTHDQLFVLACG